MGAQTTYTINQPNAYAGGIYALHDSDIISRSVQTVAGVGFGVAVSRGTDLENQCVIGGTSFLGVTVRSLDREGADATGAISYSEKETAGIMRNGYIWAVCPTGCNPGDSVNYVNATGVLDSGAAVAGETQLDGATWETVAAAGELAVLRLETTATTAGA